MAQPKLGDAPQIYLETLSTQGKRKIYAYALKAEEDSAFNYQQEDICDSAKLLALGGTTHILFSRSTG